MWTCLYYVLFKRASCFVHTVSYYGKRLCYYVKMRCYLVESICCLVQLHGVVPEIYTCALCGQNDAWVWHNNISSRQVTLRKDGRSTWLSWMRRPTGDQEVAGSTPAEIGNILSWRLIMKYFLRSFSPFCWFKKGSCQFLAKECAQYWLTA